MTSKFKLVGLCASLGVVVSGSIAGVYGFRWAINSQPIIVREADEGFMIDSFSVDHTDSIGEIWTITIPPTTWN